MRRNQGSTLIVTMVVLAGLAATLAALAESANIAAREAINRSERAQAKQACMDGIQNALSILSQIVEPGGQSASANSLTQTNLTSGSNNNTTGATMLTDDWATEGGPNGDVNYHVANHTFRMQIVDACSLMNINCTKSTTSTVDGCNTAGTTPSATQAQAIGLSDAVLNLLPFQPQEIEAIEDYRSATTTQQPLGAKDPYYQNLQTPYNCKELPFETFDELLQVQGLTEKLLYFPRTDVQSTTNPAPVDINGNPVSLAQILTAYALSPQARPDTGATKLNVNNAGTTAAALGRVGIPTPVANSIVNGRPWASMRRLIANAGGNSTAACQAILNYCYIPQANNSTPTATPGSTTAVTPTAMGLININTASASVLELLPGMTSSIAQQIVSQQSQGFLHLGDIMTVSGVTPAIVAQFADMITATSQTFIVRVIGTAGSTSIAEEAYVTVTNDTPQILSIQEQPFSAKDMIDRWTWDADTTTDTVLKDNS